MREILFRGKRIDNGEWVEGFYIEDRWGDADGKEIHGILQDRTHPPCVCDWIPIRIKKETLGQYTGISDKNGKKIFEGDVVDTKFGTTQISFDKCRGFGGYSDRKRQNGSLIYLAGIDLEHGAIIGNSRDNPELLEVE